MADLERLWQGTCERLRSRLDADSYNRYLARVAPVSFDPATGRLVLGTENEFFATWLENSYGPLIVETAAGIAGHAVQVEFVAGESAGPAVTAAPVLAVAEPEPRSPAGEPDGVVETPLGCRPDFTFETFVVGPNNAVAVAAAQGVCKKLGKGYNPLFIYGESGLGKTHLLQAIAHEVVRRRRRARIQYYTSEEFVSLYVEAITAKTLPSFRRHVRSLDLLLIDDVEFFEGKVGSSEEFFHTFNALHNAQKQIVLAADRTPADLRELEKRLVSRFQWGMAAEIQPIADVETRLAILKKKQELQSFKLSDAVLSIIAEHVQSDVRALENALTILVLHLSAFGGEMSVERARELLRDRLDSEHNGALSLDLIQRTVAEEFDVRVADLTGPRRPQNIADARQVAMYLARRLTRHSLPDIGAAFNRHHATVVHAVSKIEGQVAADEDLRRRLGALERKLKP